MIFVDLDGGHVSIPESVNLCSIPEPYLSRTRHALTLVSPRSMIFMIGINTQVIIENCDHRLVKLPLIINYLPGSEVLR